MNPPDREGRVGHPFEWGGWAPNYVGTTEKVCRHCGLPHSAHTGGEAESRSVQKRVAAQRGDYPPQPAQQGGGEAQDQDALDDMIGAFDNARTHKEHVERRQAIIDLFASRDSQLAEKDARIADLEKAMARSENNARCYASELPDPADVEDTALFRAEAKLAAQAAEIERLKGYERTHLGNLDDLREKLAEAEKETANVLQRLSLKRINQGILETRAATAERERDALRAAHTECLRRLLHRASQGDISAADVQAELAALQP